MAATRQSTSAALIAMASVVITAFIVAALYVGREILIPLALAALLSFLLAPLVTRLERWIGRIGATLAAVAILFAVIGGLGWTLTYQVIELATRLPDYQGNIEAKLQKLKVPGSNRFSRLSKTVDQLKKELPSTSIDSPGEVKDTTTATATTVAVPQRPIAGGLPRPPVSAAPPIPVEIVETKQVGPGEKLASVLTPLIGPLGTAALVLLLLVCMLLQREDLRGRVIRLIGQGNISATTRAMDDAAARISRYLFMQLIVNATYGLAVAIGLYFIGVPNAYIWGVLATVLRFIPYVGAWIAAAFPIALSLTVSASWTPLLLTVGLFIVIELISNNVMEPLLYGSSTGVSSIALIIAAVFWTWLWGAPGLVLATPLTVCLVVMGRHVPRLGALAVLLSDEDALAPHEEFYHRLLTPNANDAIEFAHTFLKTGTRLELYDSVVIPVLAAVENDLRAGNLEPEQHIGIQQEMRDVIQDLGTQAVQASREAAKEQQDTAPLEQAAATPPQVAPAVSYRVLCLPVRAERDEIAGAMLAQVLAEQEFPVVNLSAELTTGELLEEVARQGSEGVCISVTPPSTVVHARYLCGKLRSRFSQLHIVVGLWGVADQLAEHNTRLRESGADEVATTFSEAAAHFTKHATALAQEVYLLAPSPDEPERLAALAGLHLLDTEPEPAFDQITKKLARILNVPVALITFVDQDRQFFKSQFGLPDDLAKARQTPREVSICAHVVASNEVLAIDDLARDRRFSRNSALKEHGFRAYAGAPLRTAGGHVLGSLCVLDTKPRQFSEPDKRLLQVMAEEVMEAVNARSEARASMSS